MSEPQDDGVLRQETNIITRLCQTPPSAEKTLPASGSSELGHANRRAAQKHAQTEVASPTKVKREDVEDDNSCLPGITQEMPVSNQENDIDNRMRPEPRPIPAPLLIARSNCFDKMQAGGQVRQDVDISMAEETEDDDISHAKMASQSMMPIFSGGSNSNGSRPTRAKAARKRKATGNTTDPIKKPRSTKTAQMLVKKANDALANEANDALANAHFRQNTGTGENATKKQLMELQPIKVFDRHQLHLDKIQTVALKNPGADKDVIEGHIRALAAYIKTAQHIVETYESESGTSNKTVEDYKWTITGMTFPLPHHQLVAFAAMGTMENDKSNPAPGSGLLFDPMGFGKTVETIALILFNPPAPSIGRKRGGGITLVVAPAPARLQWVKEIQKHCPGLNVMSWNEDLKINPDMACRADVLVISYTQLRTAFRKETPAQKKKSFLFKGTTKFHRVVLDEIHTIKRISSATFAACVAIQAKHYWGLTGTPTPNRFQELFAYLLFIRHRVIKTQIDFNKAFKGSKRKPLSDEDKLQNTKTHLGPCMIHRKPDQMFLGTELVNLPEGEGYCQEFQLEKEERIIYDQLNEHIKAYLIKKAESQPGTKVGRKIWIMLTESLTRFRQAVFSPLLLELIVKDGLWSLDQVEAMKAKAHTEGCKETPFIDFLMLWVKEPKHFRFSTPRITSQELARADKQACPLCGANILQIKDPQQTACDHIWCKNCLDRQLQFEQFLDPGKKPACSRCGKDLGNDIKPFTLPEIEALDDTSQPTKIKGKRKQPRQPGDDFNHIQPQSKSQSKSQVKSGIKSTLFQHLDSNPTIPVPLSAKMKGIMDKISSWQEEAPLDKIIVFTQFIDVNRLMGRALQKIGIEFLYYTGDMKEQEREAAKDSFADEPDVKVMFVSLQCGGQALNLTCANRIIISDPWWNRSVEQQAFARVHRIGQKKKCYSMRFLAKDTIDTRMYMLQQAKLDETEGALGEFQADQSLGTEKLREILGGAWLDEGFGYRERSDDEEDDSVVGDDEELEYEDDDADDG